MFKVKLRGGSAKTIRERIEKKFGETAEKAIAKIAGVYGDAFVNEKMFQDGHGFKDPNRLSYNLRSAVGSTSLFDKISKIYSEAWEARYKNFQTIYKSSGSARHVDMKAKYEWYKAPWGRGRSNYKPAGYAIWSGTMFTEIRAAFQMGGNQGYVNATNLMLSGGHQLLMDGQGWHPRYFVEASKSGETLHEHFMNAGVHDGNIIQFDRGVYNDAANAMSEILQQHFVDPIVEAFNELEIRV